jgi:osmoprotectant transport system substrate-binding protein
MTRRQRQVLGMGTQGLIPVRRRSLLLGAIATGITLAIGACGSNTTTIRVGSKDFPEQLIIGEMYAQVLEANGLKVERKLNLGATPVAQAALVQNQIDLYPEYTGTALMTVLKQPGERDRQVTYNAVKEGYRDQFNLVWLEPSPMNNSFALVVTQDTAAQYNLKTLSDWVKVADQFVMVGPPEFQEREDGIPGMRQVYGDFQIKEFKAVELGLRYRALVEKAAQIMVGATTDGEIAAFDLVVLEDDRNLFPPYQVAPVVRADTLERFPQVADLLNSVTNTLVESEMRDLNNQVTGEGREPAAVARDFLRQKGLVTD